MRRVSGATPTLKASAVKDVTVRQHPLTAMESPSWQSLRSGEFAGMVNVMAVPLVESLLSRWETTEM